MCNCTLLSYPSMVSNRRMSFDISLCKPLQYYLDLLDFVKVNESLQLPIYLTSLLKSQINGYGKNCMMFQQPIENILTQYSIIV